MSVFKRKGPIFLQQVMLCAEKTFQVIGMIAHQLGDVLEAIVLEECINKQCSRLKQNRKYITTLPVLTNLLVLVSDWSAFWETNILLPQNQYM